jgi:hypothetical protein
MEEEKLDEILGILQDIQNDMGGISAKKMMPKEESIVEATEDPSEEVIETPMEEKSEMDSDEIDTSLPRWKQRLAAYGKKKIGM